MDDERTRPHGDDPGPSPVQLWGAAWATGLGSLAVLVRLMIAAGNGERVDAGLVAWAVACLLLAVFAATCAVIVAVKDAERRVSVRIAAERRHREDAERG